MSMHSSGTSTSTRATRSGTNGSAEAGDGLLRGWGSGTMEAEKSGSSDCDDEGDDTACGSSSADLWSSDDSDSGAQFKSRSSTLEEQPAPGAAKLRLRIVFSDTEVIAYAETVAQHRRWHHALANVIAGRPLVGGV